MGGPLVDSRSQWLKLLAPEGAQNPGRDPPKLVRK